MPDIFSSGFVNAMFRCFMHRGDVSLHQFPYEKKYYLSWEQCPSNRIFKLKLIEDITEQR
jgi:hypothetical protein